ncbi:hypothetical protein KR093_009772, partial [Drosophila rubida]
SPRYGNTFEEHSPLQMLQPLLHEISGIRDLHKLILLVIANPREEPQLKLHCFESETMTHLGNACITPAELQIMQQYQMLLKYEIVYTQEILSIRSLASDSAIITRLVQRSKEALLERKEPEPEPKHPIKSLRVPRIPVRMLKFNSKRSDSEQEVKKPVWKF